LITILAHCRTTRARGRQFVSPRGYSVLELVFVGAIVGLVLSIGVGSISRAVAREELNDAVRALVHELTGAQQAALTRRVDVTVSFQDNVYTVVADPLGAPQTLRVQTLPAHVSFGPALKVVTFDRRGIPQGTLAIPLTSARAGQTYTVTIEAGTGQVTYGD
jgi:type II secretory pathway pseudopilin PulG